MRKGVVGFAVSRFKGITGEVVDGEMGVAGGMWRLGPVEVEWGHRGEGRAY